MLYDLKKKPKCEKKVWFVMDTFWIISSFVLSVCPCVFLQNSKLQLRPKLRQTLDPAIHRSHEARPHAVHQHAAAAQDADSAVCGRQCREGRNARTSSDSHSSLEMCSGSDNPHHNWRYAVLLLLRITNILNKLHGFYSCPGWSDRRAASLKTLMMKTIELSVKC